MIQMSSLGVTKQSDDLKYQWKYMTELSNSLNVYATWVDLPTTNVYVGSDKTIQRSEYRYNNLTELCEYQIVYPTCADLLRRNAQDNFHVDKIG